MNKPTIVSLFLLLTSLNIFTANNGNLPPLLPPQQVNLQLEAQIMAINARVNLEKVHEAAQEKKSKRIRILSQKVETAAQEIQACNNELNAIPADRRNLKRPLEKKAARLENKRRKNADLLHTAQATFLP